MIVITSINLPVLTLESH